MFVIILIFIFALYLVYKYRDHIPIVIAYIKMKYFKSRPTVPQSELILDGEVIKIYYGLNDKIYTIHLPVHKLPYRTMGKRYYAVINGKEIDITQQHGIEYYITSLHLKADKIYIIKHDEILETFIHDQKVKI